MRSVLTGSIAAVAVIALAGSAAGAGGPLDLPEYPEYDVPSGAVTSAEVVEVHDCVHGVRTRAEVTYDSGSTYLSTLSPTLRWMTVEEAAAAGCTDPLDRMPLGLVENATEAFWNKAADYDRARADVVYAVETLVKRDKTITDLNATIERKDARIDRLKAKVKRLRQR